MEQIAEWMYEQSRSKKSTRAYIVEIRRFLDEILPEYPYIGRKSTEYGNDVRKIVFRSYTILYAVEGKRIEILTIFRENLP